MFYECKKMDNVKLLGYFVDVKILRYCFFLLWYLRCFLFSIFDCFV